MSCYFRHMQDIFKEAGIKLNENNKRKVDQAIHRIVKVKYKDCPHAWRGVKKMCSDKATRKAFVEALKKAVG